MPRVVVVNGEVSLKERQDAVDAFQTDPQCRVFIGGIQAAGVGLTLTAASTVLFAELDWTPSAMSQAEDRCHRIGQKDSVLVQHLVLEDSIDVAIAKKLVEKQTVIEAALDNETKDELLRDPIVPLPEGHATANVSRSQVARIAAGMDEAKVAAVGEALRAVEASNRIDAALLSQLIDGRLTPRRAVLGRYIARRYREQLSEELQEVLK